MRALVVSLLICCCLASAQAADPPGQFLRGIVYGPKCAFELVAPKGWLLDNEAGRSQGLPCVLYPTDSTWADAPAIIYAKIASPDFTDHEQFERWAVKEFSKARPGFKAICLKRGRTPSGYPFILNKYPATADYAQAEGVAYLGLPDGVAYIVLSARDKRAYSRHASALEEALQSLKNRPDFAGYSSKPDQN